MSDLFFGYCVWLIPRPGIVTHPDIASKTSVAMNTTTVMSLHHKNKSVKININQSKPTLNTLFFVRLNIEIKSKLTSTQVNLDNQS